MFCRVPYIEIGGRHRPYLETFFANPTTGLVSSKTLSMVDSGADHTLMPFSIGKLIGLSDPSSEEVLSNIGGVGGNVGIITRDCVISLINRSLNKTYTFNEKVWWVYPDEETKQQQNNLIEKIQALRTLQSQSISGTDLYSYFELEIDRIISVLAGINNRLEPGVLLGRPFFNNFEFIQFFHKDRENEDRCFLNYKVARQKPISVLPFVPTDR